MRDIDELVRHVIFLAVQHGSISASDLTFFTNLNDLDIMRLFETFERWPKGFIVTKKGGGTEKGIALTSRLSYALAGITKSAANYTQTTNLIHEMAKDGYLADDAPEVRSTMFIDTHGVPGWLFTRDWLAYDPARPVSIHEKITESKKAKVIQFPVDPLKDEANLKRLLVELVEADDPVTSKEMVVRLKISDGRIYDLKKVLVMAGVVKNINRQGMVLSGDIRERVQGLRDEGETDIPDCLINEFIDSKAA